MIDLSGIRLANNGPPKRFYFNKKFLLSFNYSAYTTQTKLNEDRKPKTNLHLFALGIANTYSCSTIGQNRIEFYTPS